MKNKFTIFPQVLILTILSFFLTSMVIGQYTFPLKISPNKRYLTDNTGKPFLYNADTRWVVFQYDNIADATLYFDTRKAQGFNTIQVNLLTYIPDASVSNSNANGDAPFLNGGFDISKPNEAYFQLCDQIIQLANQKGLYLTIFPIWQSDWQQYMNTSNCQVYANFIANRYKNYNNIGWCMGGDTEYSLKAAEYNIIASTIKSVAPQQLISVHGQYAASAAFTSAPWLDLNMMYTYFAPHDEIASEYANRTPIRPVLLFEGDYENDWRNRGPAQMRQQAYQSMLTGVSGNAFGSNPVWTAGPGWQNAFYTEAANGMTYFFNLFNSVTWYDLVPDLNNTFLTNSNLSSGYELALGAVTPNGRLGLIYVPTTRTITVNMAKMSAAVDAKWYSCTSGSYINISSGLSNTGTKTFTTPSGADYVLVLTASGANVAVTGVSISPTTASVGIGASTSLSATVAPSNASNKNLTWSSDNTAVATVSATGVVTGVSIGTATITVTTADGNKTATCTVTVTATAINLALNKTGTASSIEDAGFEPAKAFDGNTATRWASSANVATAWIYVDLGAVYNISRVVLNWEAAFANGYQIQTSNDASTWTNIFSTTTGNGAIDDLTGLSGNGRYVRMNATTKNTPYDYSLYEFEVYGNSGTNVSVTGVAVSPTTASIITGATTALTATVAPANATNKNVTWSSGNTAVATVSNTGVVTGVAAGTTTITVTTTDGNKTATCAVTVTAANIAVTGVTVSPTTANIVVGATSSLTATVAPANATNKNVTWSSGNTSVATVSAAGVVIGVAAGTATITAKTTDGNKTSNCAVTVTGGGSTTLNIGQTGVLSGQDGGSSTYLNAQIATLSQTATLQSISIYVKAAAGQMYMGVYNDNAGKPGSLVATTAQFTPVVGWNTINVTTPVSVAAGTYWLSFQPDNDGLGQAVSTTSGTTYYAQPRTYGALPGSFPASTLAANTESSVYATLTTGTVSVTSVTMSPTTVSVVVGATSQLTAIVTPSNATNKNVTWSSTNTAVATVSATGVVTGVTAGTATITVTTTDGSKTATCTVTVTSSNMAVTGVSVLPITATISAGGSSQLTATVAPSNATNKNVTWSSNNTGVATVNATGVVTGVAAGTATITVTTTDGNKTATCAVTVTSGNVAVTGVTVSPTTATVSAGGTSQLTATVAPANASNKTVSWSSGNTAVATVNATGIVTGVAAGTATITVTTTDGNKTATAAITVTAASNGTNLLTTNPSFESQTGVSYPNGVYNGITGWVLNNTAYNSISVSAGSAQQGNNKLNLVYGGKAETLAANRASVTAGQSYTLGVAISKVENTNTAVQSPIFFRIDWYNSSNALISSSSSGNILGGATSAWATYTVTATAPANAVKAGCYVELVNTSYPNNDVASFSVDNVRLNSGGTVSARGVQATNAIELMTDNNLSTSNVSIYPNPLTTGSLIIRTPGAKGSKHLNVYDAAGNKIYTKQLPAGSQYTIDLSGLNYKGVCLVEVSDNKGLVIKKLIVN